ncbi:cation:proton antiporter [Candidatus Uhrbacteria bacterium]|nr:cation:proton antiporter [Candidatus Uhrbacteria bacterium]
MNLFFELTIIVGVAAVISVIMRLLRQPLIIGYIFTGLLIGPFVWNILQSVEVFSLFSEIGIAILLFTVGLNLNPRVIKEFGRVSLVTGIGQVLITSVVGYAICIALGFDPATSFYLGVALAFSSTIIILKLISDKGDLEKLYAKISIGFLLVQDFIVILLLFFIPLFSRDTADFRAIAPLIGMGLGLFAAIIIITRYILPRIAAFLSSSLELLFLFAVAWGFGIASLFKGAGFSLESGALIAGVALSTLGFRHEVSARMMPLRDFFIVLFFVMLGAQMHLGELIPLASAALLLSAFVLIGNPIILMAIMGMFGYRKRTSLQTGFTVAQISEFSLIFVAMGVAYQHIGIQALSLITLVGLITIFGSSYLVTYSDAIYRLLEPYLGIFERKNAKETQVQAHPYQAILFGCNRIGTDFLNAFRVMGKDFLVIDHNPEIITQLQSKHANHTYGDASNLDFLSELDYSALDIAVSTIPDDQTNQLINRMIRARKPEAIFICIAHQIDHALSDYEQGVDYVIMPHFLGGHYAAQLVIDLDGRRSEYENLKNDHIRQLNFRINEGHEHPVNG